MNRPRRALISLYDKQGVEDLARACTNAGIEIVSTGSTAQKIRDCGFAVTPVEEVTGFGECLDGRVKTLHPAIHAGILADRRKESHIASLKENRIDAFDLVVVNLYPFEKTVESGAQEDDIIEKIDIGGPTMVRAAAKNWENVAVVVRPEDYPEVIEAIEKGELSRGLRLKLATRAFQEIAAYDVAIAQWFTSRCMEKENNGPSDNLPSRMTFAYEKAHTLRYGENPHQKAALYISRNTDGQETSLARAQLLSGKEMSYNNYVDVNAALRAAWDHEEPCIAIIKHANPCGIAIAHTLSQAHQRAHACDPLSAFGGVIAANRPIDVETAQSIAPIFTEVVAAPAFEPEALEILKKKKNLRLLCAGKPSQSHEYVTIDGGLLVQERDFVSAPGDDPSTWELVSGSALTPRECSELLFAWKSVRAVKSNAILLAKDGATVGIGMGQVNRVDSAALAIERANTLCLGADGTPLERARGSYCASDAFFPFADGPEKLARAGVKAIVQPGGSIRDEEVIACAKEYGITMYMTHTRHFFH